MNDALACDTDFRAGFCTAECTDSTSQACEQAQCGGTGATCLTIGAQPQIFVMDEFGCGEAIMEFNKVDVFRTQPGLFLAHAAGRIA